MPATCAGWGVENTTRLHAPFLNACTSVRDDRVTAAAAIAPSLACMYGAVSAHISYTHVPQAYDGVCGVCRNMEVLVELGPAHVA